MESLVTVWLKSSERAITLRLKTFTFKHFPCFLLVGTY